MSKAMEITYTAKKSAIEPADWHPADIVARLRKKGWSLRRLSVHHNYAADSLKNAIQVPWPRAERCIADAIGVAPQEIWPTRYRPDGTPKSRRNERGIGRYISRAKDTPDGAPRNVNLSHPK